MTKLQLFLTALGLAMLLEGIPYFAWPGGVRAWARQVERLRDATLRALGLGLMAAGLLVAYAARG